MNDTDRLTRQIHELQGSMLAMECFVNSLTEALSNDATAPEATVAAFERDVQRALNLLGEPRPSASEA
jgi:hypothetical protein